MIFKKGHIPWNKGKEYPRMIGNQHGFKKGQEAWNRGLKIQLNTGRTHFKKGQPAPEAAFKKGDLRISGKNNPLWKGGISKLKLYKKLHSTYKRRKKAGKLSLKCIQMVYEDNIKQYGTLTCYLCGNPIQFGEDTLEHKQPLSRGGTNRYDNLAIACRRCNSKKGKKTEEEYRRFYCESE